MVSSRGGSCSELTDRSDGISPSGSVSSMPSCLLFPWFGDRGRDKNGDGQRGEKFRSVSSSSLPYLTSKWERDKVSSSQSGASRLRRLVEPSDFGGMRHGVLAASVSCLQSADSLKHSSGVFGHIFDVSLSGSSYTYTFSSSEVSLSSSSFPSSLTTSCDRSFPPYCCTPLFHLSKLFLSFFQL